MQNFLGTLSQFYDNATGLFGMPDISFSFVDIVEILIISFLFYHILLWIKNTRAWNLFKGIIVILLFVLVAAIFQMNTILWLAENTLSVGLTALVIIFQPELRKALENLGGKNVLGKLFDFGKVEENKFSDHTIDELIKACYAMGKVKTGALIVIEDEILLNEYVRTGIDIDAIISSQLLINIFEKNSEGYLDEVFSTGFQQNQNTIDDNFIYLLKDNTNDAVTDICFWNKDIRPDG
jgi:diadenylate cyclase